MASIKFTKELSFSGSNIANVQGVTAVILKPLKTVKFKYNIIKSEIGLPGNMEIYISGKLFMVIGFPSDYLGKPYQIVSSTGKIYNGKFISNKVKF